MSNFGYFPIYDIKPDINWKKCDNLSIFLVFYCVSTIIFSKNLTLFQYLTDKKFLRQKSAKRFWEGKSTHIGHRRNIASNQYFWIQKGISIYGLFIA